MYYDEKVMHKKVLGYLSGKTELRDEILQEVSKVINGVIFTHKFTVWEPYDDLYQEAMMACLKALEKFNPHYIGANGKPASTFNYFSLTAKRCLVYYTLRNKEKRGHADIDDFHDMEAEYDNRIDYDDFFDGFKSINMSKNEAAIFDILKNYVKRVGVYNKRDFFRFARSYGWSPNLIRKFLKNIQKHKENVYNLQR